MAITPRDRDVRRAVVRLRRQHQIVALRHSKHDVAVRSGERVAHEATACRPPGVGDRIAEVLGHEGGDLVVEAFELVVRGRHVVRISADAQRVRRPRVRWWRGAPCRRCSRSLRLLCSHGRRPYRRDGHRGQQGDPARRRHRRCKDGRSRRPRDPMRHAIRHLFSPPERNVTDPLQPTGCRGMVSATPGHHMLLSSNKTAGVLAQRPRRILDYWPAAPALSIANTVSTPPCVVKLPASPNAPRAPSPAVGSSAPMPAATPIPAQPPIPESTATYCRPSGPTYVIGLPMMPDGVLYLHRSLPVFASTAFSQPSIVP